MHIFQFDQMKSRTYMWGLVLFAAGLIVGCMLTFENTSNPWSRGETRNCLEQCKPSPLAVTNETENNTRILCWVSTYPKNLPVKGKAVKETWGKRCDILLFMSSQADPSYGAIGLDVQEGHENLWAKTRAAWRYVYDHYRDAAEWFLKADDDTYVVVENLRHFVSQFDTREPHYFGRHIKNFGGYASYASGGAGYVFSRETLWLFSELLDDPSKCPAKHANEDVAVGTCLQAIGQNVEDTRDRRLKQRFMPLAPEPHLIKSFDSAQANWIRDNDFYPNSNGPECCSDLAITFHDLTPNMLYQLEYFVYHLHAFGVQYLDD